MIESDLDVTIADGVVRFRLVVTTEGEDPVTLAFPTGRDLRVTVRGLDGEDVWDSTADEMVTQATRSVELGTGEQYVASVEWHDPPAGVYEVTATLDATPEVTSTARLEVPETT